MTAAGQGRSNDAAHTLAEAVAALHETEAGRADLYALCSRLLLAAPDAPLLAMLADTAIGLPVPGASALERTWDALAVTASVMDGAAIVEEFDKLFTSTGTPVINPYASVFVAGFMHEKPLAALRADLAALGLARIAGRAEAEDHLGILCETMRVMIASDDVALRQPLARQQLFFDAHIAPWYRVCLAAIRNAAGAQFYARVADMAEAFLDIETEAFRLDEASITRMEHMA